MLKGIVVEKLADQLMLLRMLDTMLDRLRRNLCRLCATSSPSCVRVCPTILPGS
jgi:hypothetical protein